MGERGYVLALLYLSLPDVPMIINQGEMDASIFVLVIAPTRTSAGFFRISGERILGHIQGLVHMKLTSMGFSCIADFLLPRTNNLILVRSIQPARNLLGKFVRR